MKIEIKFDKDFTAVLTELAWAIGDSIKQAMLDNAKPVIVEQAPPVQPTPPIQQPQAPVQPTPQAPTTAPPAQAPTTAPSYDIQKLAVAAMQLKDAGRIGEIQELISKYGVATIMQLKPEQYDAFAQDLIAKGVKF